MASHDARRRAKNREAARKSRERKMVRLDTLEKSVAELQQENELLARCIREISEQAISAEEETQFMRVTTPCRLITKVSLCFLTPCGGPRPLRIRRRLLGLRHANLLKETCTTIRLQHSALPSKPTYGCSLCNIFR